MQPPASQKHAPPIVDVLVLSPTLSEGGAERFVSTFLCGLDEHRFRPHLCLLRDRVSYPVPSRLRTTVFGVSSRLRYPRMLWRLRSIIRKERPDVMVPAMESMAWLLVLASLGLSHRPRIIARYVNMPKTYRDTTIRRRWIERLKSRCLRSADVHVTNSSDLRKHVDQYLSASPGTTKFINDPIDVDTIQKRLHDRENIAASSPPRRRIELVASGRLVRQKRYDLMLSAVEKVSREVDVSLTILGDGPLRDDLQDLAMQLGIADRVCFKGFVDQPLEALIQADIFLMTSDHEGFPNALLEAQCVGLPSISTDCETGPREIIVDGVTGILAPPGDVPAIATAIETLCKNRDLRQRMGTAAAEMVRRRFSIDLILSRWETLLTNRTAELDDTSQTASASTHEVQHR